MSISFEDAVNEILTGKKISSTESSLSERIKSRLSEQIDVKKILSEEETEEEPSQEDGSKMKKRISNKKDEKDLEKDDEEDLDREEKNKLSIEKKKKDKKEYIENLKRDDVLQQEFTNAIYKTTKDPEGEEVLRVYLHINSKNVNIKRFGRAEILQFGDLNSILSKYGISKDDLIDNKDVDSTIAAASSATGEVEETKEEPINSFKLILKRITENSSTFNIICASQKNKSINTSSAVVSSLGMITNFDDRKQALEYVDLQYTTLILKDIGNKEVI